jgi:hypothetical protein
MFEINGPILSSRVSNEIPTRNGKAKIENRETGMQGLKQIIALLLLATVLPLIGASNVLAGDVAVCVAGFIRPDTRLGSDVLRIQPTAHCPTSYNLARTGQGGQGLKAIGQIRPNLGDALDDTGKRPLLALIVIRWDSAPTDGKPMVMEPANLGGFSAVRLDFSKSVKQDGFDIEIQAAQVTIPNDERSLACAFASNRTTNLTGAIICRSIDSAAPDDILRKVQAIVDGDLPAVRF